VKGELRKRKKNLDIPLFIINLVDSFLTLFLIIRIPKKSSGISLGFSTRIKQNSSLGLGALIIMKTLQINWLAVVACAVVAQIIPVAWYTIFNDAWLNSLGVTEAQANAVDPMAYGISFAASLVHAYVMAAIFKRMNVSSLNDGLMVGLAIGGGLIALEIIVQTMFMLKPVSLGLINGGHTVAVFVAMGAILGAWRKYA
jgi:hypothetical protein